MTSYFTIKEHTIPGQYIREYPDATYEDEECELLIHVKQYVPSRSVHSHADAVTLLGAHANGFPKELYEVMWEYLCQNLERNGIQVRSIWIADVAHQGASGRLNSESLGNSPHWNDSARDLLHLVNHFRKEMPRPLVGIGHSLGGNVLASLALMHPRLLDGGLILVDPVIMGKPRSQVAGISTDSNPVLSLVRLTASRRDRWPSRNDASQAFQRSKFYRTWDQRVLQLWLKYGLSSDTDGSVSLTTSKCQEAFTCLLSKFGRLPPAESHGHVHGSHEIHYDPDIMDEFPFYRPEPSMVFEQLPHIRPTTLWIFADQSTLSQPDSCRERVERTGTGVGGNGGVKHGKVKQKTMKDAGHLVPFERPQEVAETIGDFLTEALTIWWKDHNEWTSWWQAKDRESRTKLSNRAKNELGVTSRPEEGNRGKL